MIITRNIINKKIIFKDFFNDINGNVSNVTYTYYDLEKYINSYKNLLQKKYNATLGKTVLIGLDYSDKTQLALIFACAELGLTIIITDYSRVDGFNDATYIDPKTKLLLPIDYFITDNAETNKVRLFNKISKTTIIVSEEDLDYSENNTILANNKTILLKCTSSGTTGTPKIIEHTHEFLFKLVNRNKHFFSDCIALLFNLNHGSSLATYCLPALISEKVTNCYNVFWRHANKLSEQINHIMIPYAHYINQFLNDNTIAPNLTIYTLSTIKREWLKNVKENKIKDIISIFGSNETSGPVLINKASDIKFHESKYKKIDNFYDINLSDTGEFLITLPVYDKTINTNDRFNYMNDSYYHLGRSDLLRINGLIIDIVDYQGMVKNILDCDLVFDTARNDIYLAVWENSNDINNKVKLIDNNLRKNSNQAHFISNYAVLNYDTFVSGVKLDQELLRDYFRNYAEKKC